LLTKTNFAGKTQVAILVIVRSNQLLLLWCLFLHAALASPGACVSTRAWRNKPADYPQLSLHLRGGAGRSSRSIKKQLDKGLLSKMKRHGKGHGNGKGYGGGNGGRGGVPRAQAMGGRAVAMDLGDPGFKKTDGAYKSEGGGDVAKRADSSVLHDKHRISAVPAAAWALLGAGGQEHSAGGEAAAGHGGDGQEWPQRPQTEAPVSYLPPVRAQAAELAPGAVARSDGFDTWEWRSTKAEKDSTQRAFTGDLNRILEMSDVLLEVLDARDPDGCRTRKVEEYVHARRPELHIVLVLNKIDLVPANVTAAWVRHLKADYPVVLFKSGTRLHRGGTTLLPH